jgi:hypothetical protein
MTADNDGQPTIEQLASEGVSIRKCIASGTEYGAGSKPAATKPALAGMRIGKGSKGSRY